MKLLLALALLCCTGLEAFALTVAKTKDYTDIETLLTEAAGIEGQATENAAALLRPGADITKLDAERTELMRKSKAVHEKAMWLTMRAYDIIPFADNEPILPDGVSVLPSPEAGQTIQWVPIFEENGIKVLQDASGAPAGFRIVGARNAGNTSSDGISRIFPRAFSSPSELASYIIHEKLHFDQNTTPGLGDKKTTSELEVAAYEEEERLLKHNLLGYTQDIKERQQARLTLLLDGEKGNPGKRADAAKERAEADKLRKGRPQPERSIVSLSAVDIDRLVKEARSQIAIAQRDHDERLGEAILEMTNRSCAAPGSVTQSELDELPRPHLPDFIEHLPYPLDPRDCFKVYSYLGRGGRNATDVAAMSTPRQTPVDITPATPRQVPVVVNAISPSPFAMTFPDLAQFAVDSCRKPGSGTSPHMNYNQRPYLEFFGVRENWVPWYQIQMAPMKGCAKELFTDLVNLALEQNYGKVSERGWLEAQVARRSPSQGGPGSGRSSRGDGASEHKGPNHDDVRKRLGGVFAPKN